MTALLTRYRFAGLVQLDPFAFSPGREFRAPRGRVSWGYMVFLQLVGVGRDGHNAFRILRIAAGKKNGHTRKQVVSLDATAGLERAVLWTAIS